MSCSARSSGKGSRGSDIGCMPRVPVSCFMRCTLQCADCAFASGLFACECSLAMSSFSLKHVPPTQYKAKRLFALLSVPNIFQNVFTTPTGKSHACEPTVFQPRRVNRAIVAIQWGEQCSSGALMHSKYLWVLRCPWVLHSWLRRVCKSHFFSRIHNLFPNFVNG